MLRNNKGSIMVSALIGIIAVSVLGAGMLQYSTFNTRQAAREEREKQAFYLARTGLQVMENHLINCRDGDDPDLWNEAREQIVINLEEHGLEFAGWHQDRLQRKTSIILELRSSDEDKEKVDPGDIGWSDWYPENHIESGWPGQFRVRAVQLPDDDKIYIEAEGKVGSVTRLLSNAEQPLEGETPEKDPVPPPPPFDPEDDPEPEDPEPGDPEPEDPEPEDPEPEDPETDDPESEDPENGGEGGRDSPADPQVFGAGSGITYSGQQSPSFEGSVYAGTLEPPTPALYFGFEDEGIDGGDDRAEMTGHEGGATGSGSTITYGSSSWYGRESSGSVYEEPRVGDGVQFTTRSDDWEEWLSDIFD
jgi:hypothetical protein